MSNEIDIGSHMKALKAYQRILHGAYLETSCMHDALDVQALRHYDGDCEVTAGTLSSLARLAAASARLHLRNTVLALPDAVLAIVTFERSCGCKVSHTACHVPRIVSLAIPHCLVGGGVLLPCCPNDRKNC